jgi:Prealbumin-like fold domain
MSTKLSAKKYCAWGALLWISFVPGHLDAQTPSITTGIEGIVSVSPSHGGPSREGVTDSAPLANTVFEVANAAGIATTFTTDDAGHFKLPLPPGRYSIKIGGAKRYPRCGPFDVEVTAAGFNKVEWNV